MHDPKHLNKILIRLGVHIGAPAVALIIYMLIKPNDPNGPTGSDTANRIIPYILYLTIGLYCTYFIRSFLSDHKIDRIDSEAEHLSTIASNQREALDLLKHVYDRSIRLEHLSLAGLPGGPRFLHSELIQRFSDDLRSLAAGSITIPLRSDLDIGIRFSESTQRNTFLTVVYPELFDAPGARQLLEANYEAAARLANRGQTFTRLFLFDLPSKADTTPEGPRDVPAGFAMLERPLDGFTSGKTTLHELMEEHNRNGVQVLAWSHSEAKDYIERFGRNSGIELSHDFGFWDDAYVVELNPLGASNEIFEMKISFDKATVDAARDICTQLPHAAWKWDELQRKIYAPLIAEGDHRKTGSGELLDLPPPSGPAPEDLEAMMRQGRRASAPPTATTAEDTTQNDAVSEATHPQRVAILGLTKAVVERLEADASHNHAQLTVFDVRNFGHKESTPHIKYTTKNWLDFDSTDGPFDVIYSDDNLCNLGIWQYQRFFESLARITPPGARFIVRTTGRFRVNDPPSLDEAFADLRAGLEAAELWDQVVDKATQHDRDFTNQIESLALEAAWPAMHHAANFHPERQDFNLQTWNAYVQRSLGDTPETRCLTLDYNLRMTSLHVADLERYARPFFEKIETDLVASQWDAHADKSPPAKSLADRFKDYYRIIVFERTTVVAPGASPTDQTRPT